MADDMLYFGCIKDPGHYLYDKNGRKLLASSIRELPFYENLLDGGLLKNVPSTEGYGTLNVIRGWTIFSFWDRSVDSRQGSNSAALYHSVVDYCEMRKLMREHLPWLHERVSSKFNIVLQP